MRKPKAYFILEKTLTDTNWAHFGEIVGISIAIESKNKTKIKVKILSHEDDVEKFARNVIEVLYKLKNTHDIYCFAGLKWYFPLLVEKANSDEHYQMAEDIAFEMYDILYSVYKNLGFGVGFYAILNAYKITDPDLVDTQNVDIYFNQEKVERLKKHMKARIGCLMRIHEEYMKSNSITWMSKNGLIKDVSFDFLCVYDTLEKPWEVDTAWLGKNFVEETSFFKWMKEPNEK